jgi:hypothetical protein
MEIIEKRTASGGKEDAALVEIWGSVEGFVPATDRVLIKRLPPPEAGLIAKPEIAQEQAERGYVIAVGASDRHVPPIGALATFSKFTEEKRFDDEGGDRYVLPWLEDLRVWHNA